MKNILIILSILLFSCTKKEIAPIDSDTVSGLNQYVHGDVIANSGYMIMIYEDLGGDEFVNTTSHFYSNQKLPHTFFDKIDNPFYFYAELHNSSLLVPHGKGSIGVDILYNGKKVVTLIADSTIETIEYTSVIYND